MAPRLLYVVSEDWYFLSHRLPMARAARDAGFEVHVATRVQNGAAAILAEGFALHPIPFSRGRLSPFASLKTIGSLRRLHRRIRPDISHHVSLQTAVLASIAAIGSDGAIINALTGFGYMFIRTDLAAQIKRLALVLVLRFLFNRRHMITLVQNPQDRETMIAAGISAERIALIPGSGVDVTALTPEHEPVGMITIGYLGRLLDDKGVRTLINAHKRLRSQGYAIALTLGGTTDAANPASIGKTELEGWKQLPGVNLPGHISDIGAFWRKIHVAVLASRREGLPKSLLEAAACGRPMIATDVPGCREVVLQDRTGLLVPVDDASALAGAIEKLASSSQLRAKYGAAARQLVVERFATETVGQQIVMLYRSLMNVA